MAKGRVYIMTSPAWPDAVKIGSRQETQTSGLRRSAGTLLRIRGQRSSGFHR
jgi:hypothetical protein